MSTRPTPDPERSVLLIVDVQPDFLPGGALPVGAGDAVLGPIRRAMEGAPFPLQVATQDWHPPEHVSFASMHEGREPHDVIELYGHDQVLWPDHCVQGSQGAELHPDLPWERVEAVVRKGTGPDSDSYSGFRDNWNPQGERPRTGLAGYLKERDVEEVWLCGLARDYCVKWSAEDAAEAGFDTYVLWDMSRPVDPESDERVLRDLEERGVVVVEGTEVPG